MEFYKRSGAWVVQGQRSMVREANLWVRNHCRNKPWMRRYYDADGSWDSFDIHMSDEEAVAFKLRFADEIST